jgi:hypothetical protein
MLTMLKLGPHDVGVCSWSLQTADPSVLVGVLGRLGVGHLQLALEPILARPESEQLDSIKPLNDAGITLTAAMISFPGEDYSSIVDIERTGGYVPDELWPERRTLTIDAGALAAKLGIKFLSTHVGFIPGSNDAQYPLLIERVGELSRKLADMGVSLLMETGQEAATDLLHFLHDLNAKTFGVNFDPANMLLYGSGDPIDALETLKRFIKHVHIKDATRSDRPGIDWGREVPFGEGEVPHAAFLDTLRRIGYVGPLVIEREAGSDRVGDIAIAIKTLKSLLKA